MKANDFIGSEFLTTDAQEEVKALPNVCLNITHVLSNYKQTPNYELFTYIGRTALWNRYGLVK